MRILLIRHAEPDYSVDSLTEKGFREAELLSERLVKEPIDDFYVSPLGRAQDTIRPTLQKLHRTAETLPWLAEFRGYVYGPEGRRIPWNLAPQYWTKQPLLFEKDGWTREALMATGNCEEIYRETVEGLDALLARYGLTRDGMLYLCEKNPDVTIALTCHCALSLTLVAALTGIAQVLLCSREAPMRTLVQGILREANVQILGGEEQTTSYAEFTAYEQLFGLKLQPAQNLIRNLRAAKQPEELAMMYQAQQITDETFAQICTVIRPGMTEREIAAELIYRMLRLGAEGTSFDPIVLTGPDTSMPHGVPGDRRVAAGDFVTMDFGCRKNGYCSDMTRTVAVGMPTDEMRSVYQTVLQAQLAGIAAAKAGVTGERVDAAARKVISDAGYGDYFGHSFGHSLGLDIHEHPIAAPGVHARLPEHTVISAEPGIYLPGKFGVRIEDVMVLNETGCEVITKAPKEQLIVL